MHIKDICERAGISYDSSDKYRLLEVKTGVLRGLDVSVYLKDYYDCHEMRLARLLYESTGKVLSDFIDEAQIKKSGVSLVTLYQAVDLIKADKEYKWLFEEDMSDRCISCRVELAMRGIDVKVCPPNADSISIHSLLGALRKSKSEDLHILSKDVSIGGNLFALKAISLGIPESLIRELTVTNRGIKKLAQLVYCAEYGVDATRFYESSYTADDVREYMGSVLEGDDFDYKF